MTSRRITSSEYEVGYAETGTFRKDQMPGWEWNLKLLAEYFGYYFLHKEMFFH